MDLLGLASWGALFGLVLGLIMFLLCGVCLRVAFGGLGSCLLVGYFFTLLL